MQPLLNFGPNKKEFPGRWFQIMDISFELFFPNKVSNGTGSHLYAMAELFCGEIFFHGIALEKRIMIEIT